MQWRWLCVASKAGSESSIQLPPGSLSSQDTTFGARNSHGRIPVPLQMLDWSHWVKRPHRDREEFSRRPSCSSPRCLSLSSPGARHASGEAFIMTPAARLSECNHRRESTWEPPRGVQSTPRIVRDNNKWLFLLYVTNFGMVWYAAINNQDKLAQAWASLCSMEFKRLSKISAGFSRNRLDCSLWAVSSDALTLMWSPAPVQLPRQKSLTPSIWVSSRLHGKFKVTLLITWASVNVLHLSPYLFPFSPCLPGVSWEPQFFFCYKG